MEERKNPAYLSIGRHLSEKGVAPPNAQHLLEEAHRREAAVDVQLQQQAELARLSAQVDKQELTEVLFQRIFSTDSAGDYVAEWFSSLHGDANWLPQETDTILSINAGQFDRANLAKRWRDEQPKLWPALIGPAASVPGLNPSHDAARITRALTTNETGETREFNLIQTRRGLAKVIRTVAADKTSKSVRLADCQCGNDRAPLLRSWRASPILRSPASDRKPSPLARQKKWTNSCWCVWE